MSWFHARHDRNHMATTFEFLVSCPKEMARQAGQALEEAHREIARLERQLSEFLPESPVSLLNSRPPGTWIPLTPAVSEVLALASAMNEKSGGAFDPLSKSSGRGGEIHLSRCGKFFHRIGGGTRLGFGAIGKGYALDKARIILEREGFSDFLLSAGGSSIVLSGFSGPGTPWSWAWSWEKTGDKYGGRRVQHRSGSSIALGVSGFLEQGEHIVNPAGGRPATGTGSALVAHPSAASADALSTALFVRGWEGAERYHDRLHPTPMALIEADGTARWNGDFQSTWGPACA
jgi:thiamine biosynthesis lipoprotein